jgi:hypothetical protein
MSNQSTKWNDQDSPCLGVLYTEEWAIDAIDRLFHGDIKGAKTSLTYANMNIMKLPPGASYEALEAFVRSIGVKLYQTPDEKSPTT